MDGTRFDRIAKVFADRRLSRRQALAQGGVGIAAAGLAVAGFRPSAAQDATPAVTDAMLTDDGSSGVAMLFLQSFKSGSIAPLDGGAGRYTLTLTEGLGQTIYFSDRPDRLVGANPTEQFLAGLGFPADNPPNAALWSRPRPVRPSFVRPNLRPGRADRDLRGRGARELGRHHRIGLHGGDDRPRGAGVQLRVCPSLYRRLRHLGHHMFGEVGGNPRRHS